MYKTTCDNCEEDGYFFFRPPSDSWAGWFGGCGEFLCTGPDNVLMTDHDGTFFSEGTPMQAISHNSGLGHKLRKDSSSTLPSNNPGYCSKVDAWNEGYKCDGTNLITMEFESVAPDHNKRMHAPVYMRNPAQI